MKLDEKVILKDKRLAFFLILVSFLLTIFFLLFVVNYLETKRKEKYCEKKVLEGMGKVNMFYIPNESQFKVLVKYCLENLKNEK